MGDMVKTPLFYEELNNKKNNKKIFKKEDREMKKNKIIEGKEIKQVKIKTKNTLSIYTYVNLRRFGLCISLDDGIKINVLWLETHIKFEKR